MKRWFPFTFKRQARYLGLDLGTATIKAAVYQGMEWLTASVPAPRGGLADSQAMVAAIAEAASRTGWHGRQAVTAITGERVIVRYLRLPPMTREELKSGMAYEIENYLPPGARDMAVDWVILDTDPGTAKEQMQVLLAAAPREQLAGLYQLFHAAGLDLVAIDLVPLALCRALPGETAGSSVIIDIGYRWSDLVLAREGRPLFSRAVAVGVGEPGQPGITLNSLMAEIVQEVRRSLDFYRSQSGKEFTPERLIITGGGAKIEGLAEYCREELDLTVAVGHPCSGRAGTLDPALAVAVGLALRERER